MAGPGPNLNRVVEGYLERVAASSAPVEPSQDEVSRGVTASMQKTAGEVRFIKDRGNDRGEWAWNTPGPSQREIDEDFKFEPRYVEPLARTLRATLMALGHATSAHNTFVKLKSANVSPDGALGGKGYIQKIADMRRSYMNVVEALSALSDTLHDEIRASHWHPDSVDGGPREREEVQSILQDADAIRKDPEGWAEEEEAEMDEDGISPEDDPEGSEKPRGKTAGTVENVVSRHLKGSTP